MAGAEIATETDEVRLTMPAQAGSVGLARSLAAAIAANADLPIADLEDLRLAVSEAVTGAVSEAVEGSAVTCSFVTSPDWLQVQVRYQPASGRGPDTDGFGWAILRALTSEPTAGLDEAGVLITLRLARSTPLQP